MRENTDQKKPLYLETFHTVPMVEKVDGNHRGAPGESWVSDGGIKISSI